jgi:tripartite-type tricarboxylate transporter receptor subunit TctC
MTKHTYLQKGILAAVAGTVLAISGGTAIAGGHGAKYPNKPITFIVPYSPVVAQTNRLVDFSLG